MEYIFNTKFAHDMSKNGQKCRLKEVVCEARNRNEDLVLVEFENGEQIECYRYEIKNNII